MSDDKDIIIIFVSSTTGSLAASRVRDGYNYNRIPNKTVATPYPGDIENMEPETFIHRRAMLLVPEERTMSLRLQKLLVDFCHGKLQY